MLINTCVSSNYGIVNPQLAVLPYLTRLVSFTLLPSFRDLLKIGTGAANNVDRRKAKGLHVEVVIVIARTASDLCCWMVNCSSTQVCFTELSVIRLFPMNGCFLYPHAWGPNSGCRRHFPMPSHRFYVDNRITHSCDLLLLDIIYHQ